MSDHPSETFIELKPFGDGAVAARVTVQAQRGADGALALTYRLRGDLAALRIPARGEPLPPERLWAHTCFEVFVAAPAAPDYREFNFSPSGQWMRFDFADYRQRRPSPAEPAPILSFEHGADGLMLSARLPAAALPAGEWVLGLSTVLENADGSLAYLALHHPAAQPDFHHRGGFTLCLKA